MRVVLDASVVVKWYFAEPGCEEAMHWLRGYHAGEMTLFAPDLIVPEISNVLWKKIRRGWCGLEELDEILSLWELDCPELVPSAELLRLALELALALGRTTYDCLYIAAATSVEAVLVTADSRLADAARDIVSEVVCIS